jgi:hypothetical protein
MDGKVGKKEDYIFINILKAMLDYQKYIFKNISPKNLCFLEDKSAAFYYTMLALHAK